MYVDVLFQKVIDSARSGTTTTIKTTATTA